MGVDLGDLAVKKHITLSSLSRKRIAIDAFNVLYQFLASIRQEDGTPLMDFKGRITAHLSGLFYRTARLIENGIKPIYVFDGEHPRFKEETVEKRIETRKEAEKKWKEAIAKEDYKAAKKYAQASSRVTGEMVKESQELLDAMGIPWIDAPSEGEAQAAVMAKKGIVFASASQDYDSLLFGSPKLIRNISITGRRKIARQDKYILIEPEEIDLKETLETLGIERKQLIYMAILMGTDFNKGVPKVGPKTSLKIVKEYKKWREIEKYIRKKYNYEFEGYIQEVISFFKNPPYKEVKEIKEKEPNIERIKRILCDEHDFSEERIMRTYEKMKKMYEETSSQSKLDEWF